MCSFILTGRHQDRFAVTLRPLVLALLVLGGLGEPASAASVWSVDELEQLRSGRVLVSVTESSGPADGEVRAAIDIPAPPGAVWALLYDCEGALSFMPDLKVCKVLQAGPGGSWDVREHQVQWTAFLPRIRSVFRSEYVENESIVFKRVEGDLSYLEGSWRLEAADGGKATRVFYEVRVGVSSFVPGFMVRSALLDDIPQLLGHIRDEVVRRQSSAAGR